MYLNNESLDARLRELKEGAHPNRDQAQQALDALAEEVGVDGIELDDGNMAVILVDGDLAISLNWLPHLPGLVATAAMPEAAAHDPEVWQALLQANASWMYTAGGVFGKVPQSDRAVLARLLTISLENLAAGRLGQLMAKELAAFVTLVKQWRELLTSVADDPADTLSQFGTGVVHP